MTILEALVLTAIGSIAVWKALRHLAPKVAVAIQSRCARQMTRPSMPRLLQRYGNWLRPLAAKPESGCGSGCSACSGCAVATQASEPATLPLTFRRVDPPLPRH